MRKTIALAVAAVALTGCGMLPGQQGGGGEEKQNASEQTTQATQESPAADTATEAAPTADAEDSTRPGEQQTEPSQEVKAIVSREVRTGKGGESGRARVDITVLKRQGRTISLNWTVTVTDGKISLHNGMGTGQLDFTVSAVSLIDPVNAKRYRVARNGTGDSAECVCSDTQGQFLDKGDAATLYAVFAAPPPDVTKINVEMPMMGVFTDVPIS
ncbi:hypothetical protein [Nonomuraea rhizosphaerae]|uniref:hypothetical protein n=1 Tax=Nonomuraea rhizosphaerae TaxID=2665663 RepID=UPI001C606279|nr:hypothetical protein [Nonomuraea rhizosphaerae]